MRMGRRIVRSALIGVLGLLAVLLAAAAIPVSTSGLDSSPGPAFDFRSASAEMARIGRAEAGSVRPECYSRLWSHGRRTRHVIVYVHAVSDCPAQLDALGPELFRHGHNVVALRLPRHGLAGRGASGLGGLTAAQLRAYADRAIDLAHGLGERVDVLGLSGGGTVAAWIAQNRPDVERVVAVAPALGTAGVPGFLNTALTDLFARLPNVTYDGWSTRATAQTFVLGDAVLKAAEKRPPAVADLAVVTNAAEPTVSNQEIRLLVRRWRSRGARVVTYRFPARLRLPHDVIGPERVRARLAVTYPKLIRLVEGGPAPAGR
jgi:pimeloyl-ACP methyl ester carboxylesterase